VAVWAGCTKRPRFTEKGLRKKSYGQVRSEPRSEGPGLTKFDQGCLAKAVKAETTGSPATPEMRSRKEGNVPGSNVNRREQHREFVVGARVVVNKKAPGGYFALPGTILEIVLGSRYGVTLDNRKGPAVYLDSDCLDPAPRAPRFA